MLDPPELAFRHWSRRTAFPSRNFAFSQKTLLCNANSVRFPSLFFDARVLILEDVSVASYRKPSDRHYREPAHHNATVCHRSCLFVRVDGAHVSYQGVPFYGPCLYLLLHSFWVTDHSVRVHLFLERHMKTKLINLLCPSRSTPFMNTSVSLYSPYVLKSVARTLQRCLTSLLRWQLEHVLSSFHRAFNMRLSFKYQHLPLSLTQLPYTAPICMDTASPLATLALSMPFCERVQPGRTNGGELPPSVLLHVPRHQLVSVLVQQSMLVNCSSLKHSWSNSSQDPTSLWQSINCSPCHRTINCRTRSRVQLWGRTSAAFQAVTISDVINDAQRPPVWFGSTKRCMTELHSSSRTLYECRS